MARRAKVIDRKTAYGKKIESIFDQLKQKPRVKTGYPAEDPKTDASHKNSDLTVLFIAIIHEFGAEGTGPNRRGSIPERSHIRSSFDENRGKLKAFQRRVAKKLLALGVTVEQALELIGQFMVKNHKDKIQSNIPPPLSDRTLAARAKKGDANPKALIDTAQLLNSITTKVILKS